MGRITLDRSADDIPGARPRNKMHSRSHLCQEVASRSGQGLLEAGKANLYPSRTPTAAADELL
jgi:hypothetical protein